ncbi:unnamed protein product [Staurois parvus]|uniref:Uncharacterized protein n=1 Tax=Staurois parvus TaxID=386267 RepID=A0ABN9A9V6_9NEOB|nr:unnamed protein product [Staurois parvus]
MQCWVAERCSIWGVGVQGCRGVQNQGRTDNSWGPRAIGDHGAPVSLPTLKKSL